MRKIQGELSLAFSRRTPLLHGYLELRVRAATRLHIGFRLHGGVLLSQISIHLITRKVRSK